MNYLYCFCYAAAICLFNIYAFNGSFFHKNIFVISLYISIVAISIFMMSRHRSEIRGICYSALSQKRLFRTLKMFMVAVASIIASILYCVNVSLYSCNIISDWRLSILIPVVLFVSIKICNKFYSEWAKLSQVILKSIMIVSCISALLASCIAVIDFNRLNKHIHKMDAKFLKEQIIEEMNTSVLSNVIPLYGVYSYKERINQYFDFEKEKHRYNPYYTTFGDVTDAACAVVEEASFIVFIKKIVTVPDVFFNWLANIWGVGGQVILFVQEFLGEFFMASIYSMQLMLCYVPFGTIHDIYCRSYGEESVSLKKFYVSNVMFFAIIYIITFIILHIKVF